MTVDLTSSTASSARTVLERRIDGDSPPRKLRLVMLGCEDEPPYGPTDHTGTLFMELLVKCLEELSSSSWIVSITIYRVQQFDYPDDWDYHGVILPGSFSAAYEESPWILKLRQVIVEQIHGKIPALGICFGHQIYAHALRGGKATKCSAGPQGGLKCMEVSEKGRTVLETTQAALPLYYTHGDEVQSLPSSSISLGGTDKVPILAAAYFDDVDKLTAITFQAHPEYASDLGLKTLLDILKVMDKRGDLGEDYEHLSQEAIRQYSTVERASIDAMKRAGVLLGWFDDERN